MRKTSKIHLWIETEAKQFIEKQAREEGLTISNYCRNKLKEDSDILKIKNMLERILFLIENRKIYKEVHLTNNRNGTK